MKKILVIFILFTLSLYVGVDLYYAKRAHEERTTPLITVNKKKIKLKKDGNHWSTTLNDSTTISISRDILQR